MRYTHRVDRQRRLTVAQRGAGPLTSGEDRGASEPRDSERVVTRPRISDSTTAMPSYGFAPWGGLLSTRSRVLAAAQPSGRNDERGLLESERQPNSWVKSG